jgi:hypothetical protein
VREIHEVIERTVRDLPSFEYTTTMIVELYTRRFENSVGRACESAAAAQVARRMDLSESTVPRIDLRYLERCEAERQRPVLQQIGVVRSTSGKRPYRRDETVKSLGRSIREPVEGLGG